MNDLDCVFRQASETKELPEYKKYYKAFVQDCDAKGCWGEAFSFWLLFFFLGLEAKTKHKYKPVVHDVFKTHPGPG